jgi:hypothetical protein
MELAEVFEGLRAGSKVTISSPGVRPALRSLEGFFPKFRGFHETRPFLVLVYNKTLMKPVHSKSAAPK